MFGKMGDMMGKLQEMKKKAEESKKKLDETLINHEALGGDIKISISGNREIKSISISPELQHSNRHDFENHLINAINAAISKANYINEEEMKKAASGLLPGL